MEQFINKTSEELDNQLSRVESIIDNKIQPEKKRSEMLSMSLSELQENYPKEYQTYAAILKTEAELLHFPDVPESVEKPKINLLQAGARGACFKINFQDTSHIIRPIESAAEKGIADKASNLGIGPKQFKTRDGFIHEEFIDGTPLLRIEKEQCTPEYMESLGQDFARALNKLHENDILVNDQILTDDFGKSHMIIDNNGKTRFIDFGASVYLSDFPKITDEEVMSLMRTDPFMAFRLHSGINASEEDIKNEVKGYRKNILSQVKTKEDIIQMKDLQLLNEGLSFLNNRLPNVRFFIEGIKKELV